VSFRDAAERMWGAAGLRLLSSRLDPESRAASLDAIVVPVSMLPERYVLAWYQAALDGPCRGDMTEFRRFLCTMMDLGFGRVRKLFLGLASAEMVCSRAPDLWRHDHSHGRIEAVVEPGGRRGRVTLHDHVYTTTDLTRNAIAEIYRHALSLARVHNVTETHHQAPSGSLVVDVLWM
jgi:hypothetical protein